MKIAMGLIWQEANSFNPVRSTLRDFENTEILEGDEILERCRNSTELGGFIAAAEEARREGMDIELAPTIRASAWPGGQVEAGAYALLKDKLLARMRAAMPVDAVLLALHGAMVAEGVDDPEGDLIASVRRIVGDVPIMASCDLHANVTGRMMEGLRALRGYHESPHIDTMETGYLVGRMLFRTLAGKINPVTAWRKLALITPSDRHLTKDPSSPFGKLFARAREMEAEPGVLAASPFSANRGLDVAEYGASTVVVTDGDRARAEALADELADLFWSLRREFLVEKPGPAEAVRQALGMDGGPVIITDSSDSTNSGCPGDATGLLAELLAAPLPGPALITVVDPEAVARAEAAGAGGVFDFSVGGKRDNIMNRPVRLRGKVLRTGACRVELKGEAYHGMVIDMGRMAVVECGRVRVLISEFPGPQHEPEMYRAAGLEPREAKIVVVKSPAAWRAAYGPFMAGAVLAETPGLAPHDLASLPYTRAPRPLWPLDDIDTWRIPAAGG